VTEESEDFAKLLDRAAPARELANVAFRYPVIGRAPLRHEQQQVGAHLAVRHRDDGGRGKEV